MRILLLGGVGEALKLVCVLAPAHIIIYSIAGKGRVPDLPGPIVRVGGFGGVEGLAPFNPAVPAEVAVLVEERQRAIIAGQLHPFQEPLAEQGGRPIVGLGAVLDDESLLKMNYYVEGVVGQLPK